MKFLVGFLISILTAQVLVSRASAAEPRPCYKEACPLFIHFDSSTAKVEVFLNKRKLALDNEFYSTHIFTTYSCPMRMQLIPGTICHGEADIKSGFPSIRFDKHPTGWLTHGENSIGERVARIQIHGPWFVSGVPSIGEKNLGQPVRYIRSRTQILVSQQTAERLYDLIAQVGTNQSWITAD